MTTKDLAQAIIPLLKAGEFDAVYEQYFDTENIHHLEPQSEHFPELKGVAALREKDALIQQNIASFDHLAIGTPTYAQNYFALPYQAAFTTKDGQQIQLDELIVYGVDTERGKIISEQFFY